MVLFANRAVLAHLVTLLVVFVNHALNITILLKLAAQLARIVPQVGILILILLFVQTSVVTQDAHKASIRHKPVQLLLCFVNFVQQVLFHFETIKFILVKVGVVKANFLSNLDLYQMINVKIVPRKHIVLQQELIHLQLVTLVQVAKKLLPFVMGVKKYHHLF